MRGDALAFLLPILASPSVVTGAFLLGKEKAISILLLMALAEKVYDKAIPTRNVSG